MFGLLDAALVKAAFSKYQAAMAALSAPSTEPTVVIQTQLIADIAAAFPHQGMLGKRAAKRDPRNLRMARYVDMSTIPEPPAVVDNMRGIKNWGMMDNDKLGCCVIAGLGHAFQTAVLSHIDLGSPVGIIHPDDGTIISKYEQWCGYNPADPNSDQGGVMGDVLNLLRASDFEGRKIKAYVSVDPTDLHMMQIVCWLFNGLYTGVQLPEAWQGEKVWDAVRGAGGSPGSWGGHCVWIPNSQPGSKTPISWGGNYTITDAGFSYVDEVFALLMEDMIPPKGFDMDLLLNDLQVVSA